MSFASTLKQRIETKYRERRDNLGWRLLYSPERVLDGAHAAFIGQNPGGSSHREDHAEFAMPTGSAYATEKWRGATEPGNSPLQQQVLSVFSWIGVEPEAVLAGNLVPFRAPSWDLLKGQDDALKFGVEIWRDILAHAKPKIVIAMGQESQKAIRHILNVKDIETVPMNWGNIVGIRGRFPEGIFIGLPHLSRFQIMKRIKSREGVERLLGPCHS